MTSYHKNVSKTSSRESRITTKKMLQFFFLSMLQQKKSWQQHASIHFRHVILARCVWVLDIGRFFHYFLVEQIKWINHDVKIWNFSCQVKIEFNEFHYSQWVASMHPTPNSVLSFFFILNTNYDLLLIHLTSYMAHIA